VLIEPLNDLGHATFGRPNCCSYDVHPK
jgi:hypothetical protein